MCERRTIEGPVKEDVREGDVNRDVLSTYESCRETLSERRHMWSHDGSVTRPN